MKSNWTLPIITAAAAFGIVTMLGFGAANAQDKSQTCDATAAAYKALAVTSSDPDVQEENANVEAAIGDCKGQSPDEATARINRSIARIHDGAKTPK